MTNDNHAGARISVREDELAAAICQVLGVEPQSISMSFWADAPRRVLPHSKPGCHVPEAFGRALAEAPTSPALSEVTP